MFENRPFAAFLFKRLAFRPFRRRRGPLEGGGGKAAFDYGNFACNFLFAVLISALSVHAVASDYRNSRRDKSMRMQSIAGTIATFLEMFSSIVLCWTTFHSFAKYYKDIVRFEDLLLEFDGEIPGRERGCGPSLTAGVVGLQGALFAWDAFVWYKMPGYEYVWSYNVCYICAAQAVATAVYFSWTAAQVAHRFRRLNRRLHSRLSVRGTGAAALWEFRYEKSCYVTLRSYQRLHASLGAAFKLSNRAFQRQILAWLFYAGVAIFTTPYNMLLNLFFPGVYGEPGGAFFCLQIAWLTAYVVHTTRIVVSAADVTKQAKITARVIFGNLHPLIPKTEASQLEVFAVQSGNDEVVFSVCGLFSLKKSTLVSIFRTVATYLAIAVQFQVGMNE